MFLVFIRIQYHNQLSNKWMRQWILLHSLCALQLDDNLSLFTLSKRNLTTIIYYFCCYYSVNVSTYYIQTSGFRERQIFGNEDKQINNQHVLCCFVNNSTWFVRWHNYAMDLADFDRFNNYSFENILIWELKKTVWDLD